MGRSADARRLTWAAKRLLAMSPAEVGLRAARAA
jgi:hypothetical protein